MVDHCTFNADPTCGLFVAGFVMVSCSFPFIFVRCFGCPAAGTWPEFGYYVPFIAVSQVGWACVQISHLALIGHLASSQSENTELVSYRYDCHQSSNSSTELLVGWVDPMVESGWVQIFPLVEPAGPIASQASASRRG